MGIEVFVDPNQEKREKEQAEKEKKENLKVNLECLSLAIHMIASSDIKMTQENVLSLAKQLKDSALSDM
jgi:hypothetical protein